jgi:hypothetical protein
MRGQDEEGHARRDDEARTHRHERQDVAANLESILWFSFGRKNKISL